jgi:hypothetical protein
MLSSVCPFSRLLASACLPRLSKLFAAQRRLDVRDSSPSIRWQSTQPRVPFATLHGWSADYRMPLTRRPRLCHALPPSSPRCCCCTMPSDQCADAAARRWTRGEIVMFGTAARLHRTGLWTCPANSTVITYRKHYFHPLGEC